MASAHQQETLPDRGRPHRGDSIARSVQRGVAGLLAAAEIACSPAQVPRHLAGLHRTRVWTGASAARLVSRLHDRAMAQANTAVADYGARSELRLYLSTFPDNTAALAALDAMLRGIHTGKTPFAPPQEQQGMPGRWVTYGPGGHQMLWVSHCQLYWLQGDAETVERAAGELPAPLAGVWT